MTYLQFFKRWEKLSYEQRGVFGREYFECAIAIFRTNERCQPLTNELPELCASATAHALAVVKAHTRRNRRAAQ